MTQPHVIFSWWTKQCCWGWWWQSTRSAFFLFQTKTLRPCCLTGTGRLIQCWIVFGSSWTPQRRKGNSILRRSSEAATHTHTHIHFLFKISARINLFLTVTQSSWCLKTLVIKKYLHFFIWIQVYIEIHVKSDNYAIHIYVRTPVVEWDSVNVLK